MTMGSKDKPYLSVFSPTELVSCRHLHGETNTDLDFGSQKLRSIPVMMNLFHDLLADAELLLLFLLRVELLLRRRCDRGRL